MPTLSRDAELHYDDIGEGPPVVLLHGVTSTGSLEWRGIVGTLADDYRCVAPDLRGHGRSELGTRPLEVATLVDDFFALCEALDLKQPHCIGFSLGSHTMLRALLERPDFAASLTLIGFTGGRQPGTPEPSAPIEPPDDWPVALRKAQQHLGDDHWHMLYSTLATDLMRTTEPTAAMFATIECPVLVIAGDGEKAFKVRPAADLATAIGVERFELIADAGHAVHQEQAFTVNKLVREFVDAAEAGMANS